MRIGYITYEYPPDTAFGGIATYAAQAARLMSSRGHSVEVFCASATRDGFAEEDGIGVHHIREPARHDFPVVAGHRFARRHAESPFDVLEGPEFGRDAFKAVELVPDIPLALRLHSPSLMIFKLNKRPGGIRGALLDQLRQVRMGAGALRRGWPLPEWRFGSEAFAVAARMNQLERAHASRADEVVVMNADMKAFATNMWEIPPDRISEIPNPYDPTTALLEIPPTTDQPVVLFVGRIEVRKGVLDFADAIPAIVRRHPKARFVFVGANTMLDDGSSDVQSLVRQRAGAAAGALEFTGRITAEALPRYLAHAAVCVFPSIWENFPLVCLEAMAAARAIVAGSAGGMRTMLDDGKCGRLVQPQRPREIASAVSDYLEQPELRHAHGAAARARVLSQYGGARIAPQMEKSYQRAIEHRALIIRRSPGFAA